MADRKPKVNTQQITVEGRLGGEPEFFDINGTDLASFSIATNVYRGPNNDPDTNWYTCKLWGGISKLAEYIGTGDKVVVIGEPHIREYETDEGETRRTFEINVRNLIFAGKRMSEDGGSSKKKASAKATRKRKKKASSKGEPDIPF